MDGWLIFCKRAKELQAKEFCLLEHGAKQVQLFGMSPGQKLQKVGMVGERSDTKVAAMVAMACVSAASDAFAGVHTTTRKHFVDTGSDVGASITFEQARGLGLR